MVRGKPKPVNGGLGGAKATEKEKEKSLGSGVGALKLAEAPVYYPTEEEFKDPLTFIQNIRGEAEPFGVCRIVPPKSWKPPFALDLQTFSFPTKLQAIHQLQERPATCDSETFELEYGRFLEKQGKNKSKSKGVHRPWFQAEELDLCKLFNAVKRYGGFEKVVHDKKWAEVMRIVNPAAVSSAHYNSLLCKLYQKYLYDYEIYQMSTNSGKRRRNFKRGIKRAAAESNPVPHGTKRRRRMCQDSTSTSKAVREKEGRKRAKEKGKEQDSNSEPEKEQGREREKEGEAETEVRVDQICEQCNSGLHEELMLLCDRCDRGWHLYCLSPPIAAVPAGNWYCLDCINSERDSFGFIPGELYSLDAFRRLADKFKRKWFGAGAGHAEIERRFWEIVEGSSGEVDVMYGSDLDTSLYGSGFPRPGDKMPAHVDPKTWKEHIDNPWNLNNFPKLDGSMLRLVQDNIAGVMVPWLYIGMLFSSFCWHFEDHCFYSINYLHWGEPKCWYSVPGSAADAFEQVMRKTFPDLFEAQPDLLFQLVTMLNPSVLKANGVPVFTTLQEPGNFVITFPRSFHGGFNRGLNCAEAVNFAPADWLPHGGFGVELYRLYHKPAVLSHDELLCVVAKSHCSNIAHPFLKKELSRIINYERFHRERLWMNGVVRISRMTARKQPEYVGTEEDPECIICRYYLHLSAVVCSCRPGASVCLQHAERLCECDPEKQCLLYRYTMAELEDFLLMEDEQNAERGNATKDSRVRTRRVSVKQSTSSMTLKKKVKGRMVTHKELAETWLANSHNILRSPISESNINDILEQAEQFLWAGHEMDLVRSMEKDLRRAQKWSRDLRECVSRIEIWISDKHMASSKVPFNSARELIDVDPVPCIELGFSKLKAMVEDASVLENQIKVALSSSSSVMITELKDLQSRVIESPFELVEAVTLERVIDLAEDWLVRAEECFQGRQEHLASDRVSTKNVNMLYDLRSEVTKIPVVLPEMERLDNLIKRIEMWQRHARELLDSPLNLQELDATLQDVEDLNIRMPEIDLLRQHKSNALTWIQNCHCVLDNIHEQTDYSKVVEDLTNVLAAGRMLRVQVEELDIVELELRNFLWREKASKALGRRLPFKILEELTTEASKLQLSNDKLVVEVSAAVQAAYIWEENSKKLLYSGGSISEFKELVRKSDDICATLPTLIHIKGAVGAAEMWLETAKPFLDQISESQHNYSSPLKVDVLKDLLNKSKLLKVSLKEPDLLRKVLKNIESWRTKAAMLQASANLLLNSQNAWNVVHDDKRNISSLIMKLEELIACLHSCVKSGIILGFELDEISKLKEVSAALTWNLKALSFSSKSPSVEDVESLISDAKSLPIRPREYKLLEISLVESKQWLIQAYQILSCQSSKKKCNIQDLEDLVTDSKNLKISFPILAGQIDAVVHNHRAWQKQVQELFNGNSSGLSWPELLRLKEAGESSIVEDANLGMLASKIADIEAWILRCNSATNCFHSCVLSLQDYLLQIKDSLEKALCKFQISHPNNGKEDYCICNGKSMEDYPNTVYCEDCNDRYHSSCLGLTQTEMLATRNYVCPFCEAVALGSLCNEGTYPRVSKRNRPSVDMFVGLLNEAKGLLSWVQEADILNNIVECAKEWQSYLRETISYALVQQDKNFTFDSRRLLIVLKTIELVELQVQESSKLEVALCINRWRNKAKSLLDCASKPPFRYIRRYLKEGLSMHVDSRDYYLQELKRVERTASQWAIRAKKIVCDQGALELNEVFKFIAEGEKLPVDFRKQLAALKIRSVLYCICQKPYDEERAMIACDRCSEWYHFDCLNLPEPDSSDEGCKHLLQEECGSTGEFICPVCKPSDTLECLSLHVKVEDDDSEFTSEDMSHVRGVTPPFEFTRGKRRSRLTGKARSSLQERLKGNFSSGCLDTVHMMPSNDKNQTENLLSSSGRPCRRTAGQNSKFESFVLLTHTSC